MTLGVATSDSAAGAHATLKSVGLGGQDFFVAGYDSGHGGKPEAGMVLAFCRQHTSPFRRSYTLISLAPRLP